MAKVKYGHVDGPKDILKINRMILNKIKKAKSKSAIERYMRQSAYLYTLTFSPAWKRDLRGVLLKTRKQAMAGKKATKRLGESRIKQLQKKKRKR